MEGKIPSLKDLNGLEGFTLQELARRLNFSVEFIVPSDESWGEMTENGIFLGLLGLVNNRKVDLVMSGIHHSCEGFHYGNIDHLVSSISDCQRFITRPP